MEMGEEPDEGKTREVLPGGVPPHLALVAGEERGRVISARLAGPTYAYMPRLDHQLPDPRFTYPPEGSPYAVTPRLAWHGYAPGGPRSRVQGIGSPYFFYPTFLFLRPLLPRAGPTGCFPFVRRRTV